MPSSSYGPRHALPQSNNNHSQTSNHSHAHIGVPIPRPPSQIHRPKNTFSESNTPLSHSPSSAPSVESSPLYAFSPVPSSPPSRANPTSFASVSTNLTTPPSSIPFNSTGYAPESRGLSYPSVPPPSLSSSFGSPTVPLLQIPNGSGRDVSLSPIEPLSRRNSNAGSGSGIGRRGSLDRRVLESSGSIRGGSGSGSGGGRSRRGSFEVPIGGRVAESGTLLGRSRGGSFAHGASGGSSSGGGPLPETVDEVEDSSSSPLPITMEFGEVSNNNNGCSSPFSGGGTRMLDAGDLEIPSTKSR